MANRGERLTRKLIDQGRLIEAGFISFRRAAMPSGVSQIQVEATRIAFFAGAQHLFSSLMTAVDTEIDPYAQDITCMECIEKELQTFIAEFEKRYVIPSEH